MITKHFLKEMFQSEIIHKNHNISLFKIEISTIIESLLIKLLTCQFH